MPRLGPEISIVKENLEISGQRGPSLDSDLTSLRFYKGESLSLLILPKEGCFMLTNEADTIYVTLPESILNTFRKRNPSIKQVLETQSLIENGGSPISLIISRMLGDEEDYYL